MLKMFRYGLMEKRNTRAAKISNPNKPILLICIVLLAVLMGGCSSSTTGDQIITGQNNSSSGSPAKVINPAPTPISKGTTGAPGAQGQPGGNSLINHKGPATIYPDPKLTPGDVFPGVTAKQVCVSGYSKSVRSVSAEEKAAVYQSYGIADEPGKHEVDHFISLELGGSNNLKNLWPEPYEPRPGAYEKDTVENALHNEVCAGRMSLEQAQKIIVDDWYAYYLQIHKG